MADCVCPTGRYDYSSYITCTTISKEYFKILLESRSCALIFEINHVRGEYFSPNSSIVCWPNRLDKRVQITQPRKSAKAHRNIPTKNERHQTYIIISYRTIHLLLSFLLKNSSTTAAGFTKTISRYSLDLIYNFRLNIIYK